MNENPLPQFDSTEALVEFFDTHDMGEYGLPEVEFDVAIQKRTFWVSVNQELMRKLLRAAQAEQTSTEELANA